MSKVIMLCGVPGSGKTWVIRQLGDKFHHVSHDDIPTREKLVRHCYAAAAGPRPVIVDCPFAERLLRDELEAAGLHVVPVFIVEPPHVVAARYLKREGKPATKATITRAETIKDRAAEWGAQWGTSAEILDYLRSASVN
jgi:predicted kinase